MFALHICRPPSWMRERVRSCIKSRPSAFELGMKHLLHISYKTRMLNGIIYITTFQMQWNIIFVLLQSSSMQWTKTNILLQKLYILKQYAIMRQNGAGSDKQKRFDVDQIVA